MTEAAAISPRDTRAKRKMSRPSKPDRRRDEDALRKLIRGNMRSAFRIVR
jgi:hypothetical protein